MPQSTFTKLNAARKERFIQACLNEFASHTYDSASVTKIAKHAGIAKGSVYQYFKDKTDLYEYIVSIAYNRKQKMMGRVLQHTDNDLITWYLRLCLAEIRFSAEFPLLYGILEKAGDPGRKRESQQLLILRQNMERFSGDVVASVDKGKLAFIMNATKEAMVKERWHEKNLTDREILNNISEVATIIFGKVT